MTECLYEQQYIEISDYAENNELGASVENIQRGVIAAREHFE